MSTSNAWHRDYAKERRDRNKANGRCLNHDERKATHGVRCSDCYWRHAYGLSPSIWERTLMLSRELKRIANTETP